jgi:hypothetical protein
MTGQLIPQSRITEASSSQAVRGETVPLAGVEFAGAELAGEEPDNEGGWCAEGRVEPGSDNQRLP